MNLNVYADPSFRKTLWFMHILRGIAEEAERRHYKLVIPDEAPHKADFPSDVKPIVIVVGNSAAALGEPLRRMWEDGIHTVIVNFMSDIPSHHSSVIIMDYADAVVQGIRSLRSDGRTRTALFGVYPDSEPDKIKLKSYLSEMTCLGIDSPEKDVFTVTTDLCSCVSDFSAVGERYDSVICCNDLAAVALNRALGSMNERITMAGFVDRMISDFSVLVPGIITLSAEHREFGRQAVKLYSWLQKNDTEVSVTVRVPVNTDCRSYDRIGERDEITSFETLSEDPLANEILRVEHCLSLCDRTDIAILRGLCNKLTRTAVAQSVFISERAVGYRLKKLCSAAGCGDVPSLISLIGPWIADKD